jgi:hypothetical protein
VRILVPIVLECAASFARIKMNAANADSAETLLSRKILAIFLNMFCYPPLKLTLET